MLHYLFCFSNVSSFGHWEFFPLVSVPWHVLITGTTFFVSLMNWGFQPFERKEKWQCLTDAVLEHSHLVGWAPCPFYQAGSCLLALCCLRQGLATEAVPWYRLVGLVLCPHGQDLHTLICTKKGTNQDSHFDPIIVLIQVNHEVLGGQVQLFSH